MTFREKIKSLLEENGLFEDQAGQIVDQLILDKASEPMSGRWDEDISGYPPQMLAAVWASAKAQAVAWIDKNLPRHWARPLFAQ